MNENEYLDFADKDKPNVIWTWTGCPDEGYSFEKVELNAAVAGE